MWKINHFVLIACLRLITLFLNKGYMGEMCHTEHSASDNNCFQSTLCAERKQCCNACIKYE